MIEKSLTAPRKKKVKGQLHKLAYITDKEAKLLQKFGGQKVMTPEKIPAYPPPGERGGPGSGAEGRAPSGGGGGDGRSAALAAQAAASAASAARSRAAAAAEQQAAAQRDMQATIAQAEKAKAEYDQREASRTAEANRSNQLAEARRLMTQPTAVANPLARTPIPLGTVDPYQQSYVYPDKIWTDPRSVYEIGDYNEIIQGPKKDTGAVDVGFQEALRKQQIATDLRKKQQDPDYGQFFRQPPVVEQPKFFDTGVGKFVKGVGKVALQPFIPEPIQRALTGIGTARAGAKFAKAITGKNIPQIPSNEELIRTALTQGPTTETKRKTNPLVASDRDGQRVKTVAEKVATGQGLESGQKLLGVDYLRQKEEARRRGKMISEILNKNSYQGKDLTSKQRNDLINYIEQINKFLVPTVQGA